MEVVAQAPEEALRMAVFLVAENLGPEDEVLFDNVSAREILQDK